MKNLFERIREQHANIFRVFVFLLSAGIIVYMFPKQAEFKYEFDAGKPWLHEDLIAPFDYAIRKSDEAVEAEKKKIRKNVKPFYVYNKEVTEQQIHYFRQQLERSWNDSDQGPDLSLGDKLEQRLGGEKRDSILMARYQETGSGLLRDILERGIVQVREEHEEQKAQEIIFVRNNVAREIPVDSLFNFRSAFQYAEEQLQQYDELDRKFLLDLIERSLHYNVVFDKSKTERTIQEQVNNISRNRGKVEKDVLIISKGDIVTEGKYQKLTSLQKEYEEQLGGRKNYVLITVGQSVLVLLCLFVLFIFLIMFRRDVLKRHANLIFILLLIILMVFLTKVMIDIEMLDPLLAPLCILPIIIRAFYDNRFAIYVHFISVLLASFLVPNQFEFAFLQIIAGVVVIYSIVNMRKRAQFFKSALIVFLIYFITYLGIALIQEGELRTIEYDHFGWFAGNALFTLFASYPLIYLFEKLFGFLSEMSLVELSDTNSPLLRQLASHAPGTFQHSLQVADLAEEVVHEVGGDALLVRAGALYHDIGKMDNPLYFTENQTTGVNPHKDLRYGESARVIIHHVIRGIELAKRYNLPDALIDFIRTHHGNTRVEYFYKMKLQKLKKEAEERGEDPEQVKLEDEKYRYPGPLPYSKETAILMLADSVEAASKSLKQYDVNTIENLVENIINDRVREEQLINAPITMKDITRTKKILKRKLMNIYHVRVEYPQ